MIVGVGIDLCEIDRMDKLLREGRFLERFFTESEKSYILDKGRMAPSSMAGIFAAKEALLKAFGTGLNGIEMRDICVEHTKLGAPCFHLSGTAAEQAGQMNITALHLSITHEGNMAAAIVTAERNV